MAQILVVRPEKRTDAQKAELQAYFRQNVAGRRGERDSGVGEVRRRPAAPCRLAQHGYSAADNRKVMHGTWVRLLRMAWKL